MMEDFDIYSDLPSFHADDEENKKLCEDNTKLKSKNQNLEKELNELKNKVNELENVKTTLQTNFSSLIKTAKAEIKRKDRTICDLRAQLDNFSFRRKPYIPNNQNFRRVDDLPVVGTPALNAPFVNDQLLTTPNLQTDVGGNQFYNNMESLYPTPPSFPGDVNMFNQFYQEEVVTEYNNATVSSNYIKQELVDHKKPADNNKEDFDNQIIKKTHYKSTIYGERLRKKLQEEKENASIDKGTGKEEKYEKDKKDVKDKLNEEKHNFDNHKSTLLNHGNLINKEHFNHDQAKYYNSHIMNDYNEKECTVSEKRVNSSTNNFDNKTIKSELENNLLGKKTNIHLLDKLNDREAKEHLKRREDVVKERHHFKLKTIDEHSLNGSSNNRKEKYNFEKKLNVKDKDYNRVKIDISENKSSLYTGQLQERLLKDSDRKKIEEGQKKENMDKIMKKSENSDKENFSIHNKYESNYNNGSSDKTVSIVSSATASNSKITDTKEEINKIEYKESQRVNKKIEKSYNSIHTESQNYNRDNYEGSSKHKNYKNKNHYDHHSYLDHSQNYNNKYRYKDTYHIDSSNRHSRRDTYSSHSEKYVRTRSLHRYASPEARKISSDRSVDKKRTKDYRNLEHEHNRTPKKNKRNKKDKEERRKFKSVTKEKEDIYRMKTPKRKRRSQSEEKSPRKSKKRKDTSDDFINDTPISEETALDNNTKKIKYESTVIETGIEYKLHRITENTNVCKLKDCYKETTKKVIKEKENVEITKIGSDYLINLLDKESEEKLDEVIIPQEKLQINNEDIEEGEIIDISDLIMRDKCKDVIIENAIKTDESVEIMESNSNNIKINIHNFNNVEINENISKNSEIINENYSSNIEIDKNKSSLIEIDKNRSSLIEIDKNVSIVQENDENKSIIQENDKIETDTSSLKTKDTELSKTVIENSIIPKIISSVDKHDAINDEKSKNKEIATVENKSPPSLYHTLKDIKPCQELSESVETNNEKKIDDSSLEIELAKLTDQIDDKGSRIVNLPTPTVEISKENSEIIEREKNQEKIFIEVPIIDNEKNRASQENEGNGHSEIKIHQSAQQNEENIEPNASKNVVTKRKRKTLIDSETSNKNKDTKSVTLQRTIDISRTKGIKNIIIIKRRRKPVELSDSPPVLVITPTSLNESK